MQEFSLFKDTCRKSPPTKFISHMTQNSNICNSNMHVNYCKSQVKLVSMDFKMKLGKFCTFKRLTTKEVFYFGVEKKTVISAQV